MSFLPGFEDASIGSSYIETSTYKGPSRRMMLDFRQRVQLWINRGYRVDRSQLSSQFTMCHLTHDLTVVYDEGLDEFVRQGENDRVRNNNPYGEVALEDTIEYTFDRVVD